MIDERFGFLLQGDALLAPQGRAEDIHAAVTYQIDESIRIRGGYRILEGGAKNDKVYGFSLFHYAAFGVSYAFKKKLKVSDTPE
jgi:predicted porin